MVSYSGCADQRKPTGQRFRSILPLARLFRRRVRVRRTRIALTLLVLETKQQRERLDVSFSGFVGQLAVPRSGAPFISAGVGSGFAT